MILRALLLSLTFLYSSASLANEVLNFKEPIGYKEKFVISFLDKQQKQPISSYALAKVDLNEDAIDEYIVKPSTGNLCKTPTFCPHYIIILHKYQPLLIGQFDAEKIIVENDNSYGVRHLRIYDNANNNFTYSTAHWNPFSFQYEKSSNNTQKQE